MTDVDTCSLCAPSPNVLFRSEHVVAFHSSSPVVAGHVIVATAAHRLKFGDLAPDEAQELFSAVWRLAIAVEQVTQADRVYVLRVGDSIEHIHAHILPSQIIEGAGALIFSTLRAGVPSVEPSAIGKVVDALRSNLGAHK